MRDKCHECHVCHAQQICIALEGNLTREQASNAIDELAESGYAGPVAVYLNNIGKAFFGTVVMNGDGLLVVDGGRVFVRCEGQRN